MTSIGTHPPQPDRPGPPAAAPPDRVDPVLAASAAALLSALVREEPLDAAAVGLPEAAPRSVDPAESDAWTPAPVSAAWAGTATPGEQVRRRGVFGRR